MPQATVVCKFVNPPKPGKRYGSVKDPAGIYWSLPPNLVSQVTQGASILVNYEETPEGYKNIKSIVPTAQPQARQNTPSNSNEEAIFVTGCVGRALGSGQFGISDIKILTLSAAEAYRAWKRGEKPVSTIGSPEPPTPTEDHYGYGAGEEPPFQ